MFNYLLNKLARVKLDVRCRDCGPFQSYAHSNGNDRSNIPENDMTICTYVELIIRFINDKTLFN